MRVLKSLKYAILLAGLGLLFGGIYFVLETWEFLGKAESVEGTVIHVQSHSITGSSGFTYRPTVRFTAKDGRKTEFEGSYTSWRWVYRSGESVPVWYSPADPQGAKLGGWFALWHGPAIAIGFGGLISLIFAVIYGFRAHHAGVGVYLRYFGVPVRTRYVAAKPNPLTYINDIHPFNVVSRWRNPRTGKTHEFTSEDVWSDLSQYIPDGEITVYIKPGDPGTYRMDMSFLSARKPPALEDPFATRPGARGVPGSEIPLGTAVRANWGYLLGAPLWGLYMFFLQPLYGFPVSLNGALFFATLGLAIVPVIRGKAPITFWFVAVGLWTAGIAVGIAWEMTAGS